MPKMSFKCKECGEKIVVKEPGMARCEECGSIYKAFFEIKKKSDKEVISKAVKTPENKEASERVFGDHKSA
ncbi:MAG: hypothetical protein AB7E76_07605 [Deferribacterales bacterium]|jgi:uncharacterized Zn finger protein